MNTPSHNAVLGLAAIGFLSYTACSAEKSAMENQTVISVPAVKSDPAVSQTVAEAPRVVDGIFATNDHLQPAYFELNHSKLSEKEMDVVKANAEWLKAQPPFLIRIIGYADSRGSMKKNERLAILRANAVREAYIALGLPKERLSITGRGAEDPACQPMTEECLSKSRRGETLIEDKSLASR